MPTTQPLIPESALTMLTITSDCYSVDPQIINSDALPIVSSLLSTVSILLAGKTGGPATQAKHLLNSDGGSLTYPVGGLHEAEEYFDTGDQECSQLTAWELLPSGKVSVLSATPDLGFKLPMTPGLPDFESSLQYLDALLEALERASLSGSDRLMIQRSAILELRNKLDCNVDFSTSSNFEGDLPTWWPEVVAYGKAQGVAPSPQKEKTRGMVMLFADVYAL